MRDLVGNNSNLTEMNRSAVVKILQQQEVCSRADIARQTGLTQAAITKIVAALIEMDIVSEVGVLVKENSKRRSIGLKLNAGRHQIIGVKFARQMYSVGVFDISGKVYTQTKTQYSVEENPRIVLASMKKQIHEILAQNENVVSIGLAVPGPYLRDEGHIAVVTQMTAWHSINFREEFRKEEFGKPVFIEHDANAGALAEWLFGGHAQPHTLAYFLVGDGVGSGVIERGSLLVGAQGTACETGHISVDVHGPICECGNYGCLEMYCSALVISKQVQQQMPEYFTGGDVQNNDACDVLFKAARKGDKKALAIVRKVAEYIGYGCVTLINAYNPDIIVIGDVVSRGGDLLLPIIKEVVAQRVISELHTRVKIQISALEVDPTLYGAAATATNKVLQLPSQFSAVGNKKNGAK